MELVRQVVNLVAGNFDLVAGRFDLTAVEVVSVLGRYETVLPSPIPSSSRIPFFPLTHWISTLQALVVLLITNLF
jgi:hypothetical protein